MDTLSIWHWLIVIVFLTVPIPVAAILKKCGLHPAWAILYFLPVVNIVALWVWAFSDQTLVKRALVVPPATGQIQENLAAVKKDHLDASTITVAAIFATIVLACALAFAFLPGDKSNDQHYDPIQSNGLTKSTNEFLRTLMHSSAQK